MAVAEGPFAAHSWGMNTPPPNLPRPGRASRAKWLFFFSFLTLFCIADCVHDYISLRGTGDVITVLEELEGGLYYWGPCLAFVPLVIALVKRFPMHVKRPASIAIHLLAGLLFTYVNVMIQALPTHRFPGSDLDYWGRFLYLLKFEFAVNFAFYVIIVVSIHLLQQYEDLKEREIRASQLELALGETRLRAIQAQLNPHFFFNTLQAISVMALAGEREGVVDMLGRLSSLLRVSFDKHRPQQVTLSDELAFIEGYLAIQQLCFGQRLVIRNDIEPGTLSACVPSMLLQPLVENALVHGIAVKPGKGVVRLVARKSEADLVIEIADSGPGFRMSEPYRSGVGLSATESRLKLLFGSHHCIEYGRSDLGGANVTVRIPFQSGATGRVKSLSEGVAA
jgi:hypothetical protein